MRWHREAYMNLMAFGDIDRPMFTELFGPLIGLPEEWIAQGATPDELDLTAFDFDWVSTAGCGGETEVFGLPAEEVLSEDGTTRMVRDGLGRVTKLFKRSATIPMPISYPVATFDDWLLLKPYYAFSESRVSADGIAAANTARNNGGLVTASMPGGFNTPRELMGEEAACLACFDEPGLIDDMLETCAETTLKVLERIFDKVQVDLLHVHEDMAGKSGPLFGPAQIERFISPYYRKVWNECSRQGVRIFSQDSDGNMNPVLQTFAEAGINAFYPCEPAAGMDIVAIRKQYGHAFALKGGIDKHVLREDRNAIIRELDYKLQPMMHRGTVFALDHRIPNGTPLENYRFYVKAAREILGIPAGTKPGGWERMAF